MSRIGVKPVPIPSGVSVTVKDSVVFVKGSKGELSQPFRTEVSFTVNDGEVKVSRGNNSKTARSMHGLYRKLLDNMVVGVSKGFRKVLVLNGVGYRVELKGQVLLLNLGYSNQIEYVIPKGADITVEGNNKIVINGIDRQLVGQTSAEIRGLRPPEPYKGKGIRYENEHVRRKVGKAGVK